MRHTKHNQKKRWNTLIQKTISEKAIEVIWETIEGMNEETVLNGNKNFFHMIKQEFQVKNPTETCN